MGLRRRDLWIVLAIAAAFALLRLPRAAELAPPPLPGAPREARAAAPAFELPRVGGGRGSLAELRGRVVLLHFWATWCPPCREELPALASLERTLAGEGLAVLTISVDGGSADAVARFLGAHGLALAALHDPREQVARLYGVGAYPTSAVIDRSGRLVCRLAGAFAWDDPGSVAWFRGLLREGQ